MAKLAPITSFGPKMHLIVDLEPKLDKILVLYNKVLPHMS